MLVLAALAPAPVGAQGTTSSAEAVDTARLVREATARAQAIAVSGGPGALQAEIARELFSVGRYEDFYLVGDFAPALANFPAEAAAAFQTVDVEAQYNLLLWSWRRLRFPAMAPVLRRLYLTPPEEYAKIRDLALRRLFELTPDQARPLMLSELQRSDLRVSMVTLGQLPDTAFPEFEPMWLRRLDDGILDERLDAAVRIDRFGSAAILSEVKRLQAAHGPKWSCEVRVAVFGYLMRVDAVAAAPMVREAASAPVGETEDCRPAFMRSPALRMQVVSRMSPLVSASVVTAGGPVAGDERRQHFRIDDEACESEDELIARLTLLPSGTRLSWRYDAVTATAHPERWTQEEREAVLTRIQRSLSAGGIILR